MHGTDLTPLDTPQPEPDPLRLDALREKAALACRILAHEGLADGILGHVSIRIGPDRMLIRCRGEAERGLTATTARDIRLTTFAGRFAEPADGYAVPNELPLHGEVLRSHPQAGAVVHVHPPAVLLCGLAGLPLRPVFGAYNIPALRMAIDGVPVFPRSVLVRTPELAREMMDAMGDARVCVLRGHGITAVGDNLEQAVVRAIDLNTLAQVTLDCARLGVTPAEVPPADLAELPDLGSGFNDRFVWQALAAKLVRAPGGDGTAAAQRIE
jgi:ribulose-5-phosphate 4-epimerase/fuculose-1-phosphate aldolase